MYEILFYVLSIFSVASALAMLFSRDVVKSGIAFGLCVVFVSGLFLTLSAPFAAIALVLSGLTVCGMSLGTYLLTKKNEDASKMLSVKFSNAVGVVVSLYMAVLFGIVVLRIPLVEAPQSGATYESLGAVGRIIALKYDLVLLLTGVLFFTAIVSAAAISRRAK